MSFTRYPNQLDSTNELPIAVDNHTFVRAEIVNRLRDAITAIESELGIKPSTVFGNVRARLDYLEALALGFITTLPVTQTSMGGVNAFGTVANLVLQSDGVTPGGVWRDYLDLAGSLTVGNDIRVAGSLTVGNDIREVGANGAGVNAVALGATKVLVVSIDSQVQLLDPNGASRDVTLPADNLTGLWYWIQNTGALGLEKPNGVNCYNLIVKRAGGATVSTIAPGQGAYVKCTGATWAQVDKIDRVVSNATYSPSVLYTNHTTPYVVAAGDSLILIDSTTGIITVTLPAVATSAGRHLHICDWTRKAGTNKITIAAQGGQTVNGAATADMTKNGESAYLYCDGLVWNTLAPVS